MVRDDWFGLGQRNRGERDHAVERCRDRCDRPDGCMQEAADQCHAYQYGDAFHGRLMQRFVFDGRHRLEERCGVDLIETEGLAAELAGHLHFTLFAQN